MTESEIDDILKAIEEEQKKEKVIFITLKSLEALNEMLDRFKKKDYE